MPLMAKNIYVDGVNAPTLVLLRNLLALPIFYLIILAKKLHIALEPKQYKSALILSVFGSVLTPTLLFYSYNYISSGMATTLHFVYPVFVVLGCALFFGDGIGLIRGGCVLLCSIGTLLFYSPGEKVQFFGMALAVVSGITLSVYIIYLGKSSLGKENAFKVGFYNAGICAVTMTGFTVLTGNLALPKSLPIWLLCMVFSLVVMIGAVVLFQMGTAIVGPQRAAILSTFEPITGIAIGIAAFDEPFGLKAALGSVAIIAAVILLTLFDKQKTPSGQSQ